MATYTDVIIIGGGPAGSTCAWKLQKKGVDCLLLDKQVFPRAKPCGGWLMPEVLEDLEIDPGTYPHNLMSFDSYHLHFKYLNLCLKSLQFAIQRHEFDDWLLKRSGVPVINHQVAHIREDSGYYVIDDLYKCKYLVGAGGTNCPVYRTFFKPVNPRARELQAVTLVEEFPYDCTDENLHLWFSINLLPGYAWYVPKSKGVVNVGIGTLTPRLQRQDDSIKNEWQRFIEKVAALSLVNNYQYNPRGYVYYLRSNVEVGRLGNAFVVGDAAGLATRDMAEGIGPAVKSGLLAAESITADKKYDLSLIKKYSSGNRLLNRVTEHFLTDS
jgi:flavin-dependent dehydrogenase